MNNNDEFDQILDDALAEYREAEPLARLEDRVLQRLRLHAEHRRKLWWRWSAIAGATATLAITAWMGLGDRAWHKVAPSSLAQKRALPAELPSRAPVIRAAREQPASTRASVAKAVRSQSSHVFALTPLASAQRVAMRDQFPAPAPLKPEERVLLALAQIHPGILDRSDDDKEIVIAPIDIKPLAGSGDDQGEN